MYEDNEDAPKIRERCNELSNFTLEDCFDWMELDPRMRPIDLWREFVRLERPNGKVSKAVFMLDGAVYEIEGKDEISVYQQFERLIERCR